jgi:hypothetical protein
MTITAVTGCKNEQDIIEPFVRHTLKFCDRLIISDNSIDATKDILYNLCGEFHDRITLLSDTAFAYDQKRMLTGLFQAAANGHPEFIVPVDVDEFISAPTREIFEKHLSEIPEGGVGRTPWRTYVVHYPDSADALRIMIFRRKVENPQYWKCIIRLGLLTARDVVIEMGNHEVLSPTGKNIPRVDLDLSLLHFPVRSYDQFMARIVVNWMAQVTRDPNIASSGSAFHIRDLFQKLVAGEITNNNLPKFAIGYAQGEGAYTSESIVEDEHGIDCTRKYSTGKPMAAVCLIAKEWEKSLAK